MTAEIQQGLHILSTMTGNASLAILKSHLMPIIQSFDCLNEIVNGYLFSDKGTMVTITARKTGSTTRI